VDKKNAQTAGLCKRTLWKNRTKLESFGGLFSKKFSKIIYLLKTKVLKKPNQFEQTLLTVLQCHK